MRSNFIFLLLLITSSFYNCSKKPHTYDIAYSSDITGNPEVFLTDANGVSRLQLTHYEDRDGYPAWSPDGKKIAFYAYHGIETWSIHTMDTNGENRKRLTNTSNKWDNSPSWSPDGKRIAFAREYKDTLEIWIMNSDGGKLKQLRSIKGGGPCFTKDGNILFHSEYEDSEICITDSKGSNIIQLTDNNAEDWHPEISPDNKQIVFMSDRDGNYEIYIMSLDGTDQKRLTYNNSGDWEPSFSPDGSMIIFTSDRDGDFDIYIMNKNGSQIKNITKNDAQDLQASWLNKRINTSYMQKVR